MWSASHWPNQAREAKRSRKRRGSSAGILTNLIDFDPLDEAEWLSVAHAIGCEPAELDKMTAAKELTWRAGVECVSNNLLNLLEAEGSGPTVPQLAGEIASRTEEFRKSLADTKMLRLGRCRRYRSTPSSGPIWPTRPWNWAWLNSLSSGGGTILDVGSDAATKDFLGFCDNHC